MILAELIRELGSACLQQDCQPIAFTASLLNLSMLKTAYFELCFDEIDQAVNKISDGFLYTLTRPNSELKQAQISIVGISNSLTFMDAIDPRARSFVERRRTGVCPI